MAEVRTSDILTERRGRIARITLNRPESLKALSVEMRAPLLKAFEETGNDPGVRVIVVTGSGRGFSSGGGITFMESVMSRRGKFEDFRPLVDSGRDLILAMDRIEKPLIAAVNGPAAA